MLRLVSLVPFGYFWTTRINGRRDLVYLLASSWIPAIWVAYRTSGLTLPASILQFLLGYLAFIAVYEIGYLANDAWDAKKSSDGRQRLRLDIGTVYILLFVVLRLAVWAIVGWTTGWVTDIVWLAGYAALAAAFTQHNLISAAALRSASFLQLAILRFSLPVIGIVPREEYFVLITAATFFYAYFRFLSYLESKDLLKMPERRSSGFGLAQTAMLSPMIAWLAILADSTVTLELLAYFVAIYLLWSRSGAINSATARQ